MLTSQRTSAPNHLESPTLQLILHDISVQCASLTRQRSKQHTNTRLGKWAVLSLLIAQNFALLPLVLAVKDFKSSGRRKGAFLRKMQGESSPLSFSNLNYYDLVRTSNAHKTSRVGSVDVISQGSTSNGPVTKASEELGMCHLTALWRYSTLQKNETSGEMIPLNRGSGIYDDSAAALLAAHHFNHGIGDVVNKLTNINKRCNIRFTMEFLDSFSSKPKSVEQMTNVINRNDPVEDGPRPCAIVGPYRSAVSTAVAVITGVYDLPQISTKSTSPELDSEDLYPLFTRTIPSDTGTSLLTVKRLLALGVKHVGVLNVDDAYGYAYQQAFKSVAEANGMKVAVFSFDVLQSSEGIRQSVEGLASTGYNYFFCIIFPAHYDIVMQEAYNLGIAGNPDRVTSWTFSDGMQRYVESVKFPQGSPLALATQGTGMIQADGAVQGMPGYDRFVKVWNTLDKSHVDFFNSKQPPSEEAFYFQADTEYFKRNEPTTDTLLAYDAVVALGLAACNAAGNGDGDYFDGPSHFDEIVKMSFQGASGQVKFDRNTTSRDPTSASYGLLNAIAQEPDENGLVSFRVEPSAVYRSSGTEDCECWESIPGKEFKFPDGTARPPSPLAPYDKNMNYIGDVFRSIGITFGVLSMSLSAAFAFWTMKRREERIVRASEPMFLLSICVGTAIMASSIIPLSMDDEIASDKGTSISCMAVPWLYSIGYTVAFSALFAKTWAISKVCEDCEVQVVKVDLKKPLLLFLLLNVLALSLWTATRPLIWVRVDEHQLDQYGRATSSVGMCLSTESRSLLYICLLAAIDITALFFACFLAYRARDITTEFFESRYVTMALAGILQASFLGVPLMVIVHGQPKLSFVVATSFVFITAMSILLLIFVPKLRSARKYKFMEERRPRLPRRYSNFSQEDQLSLHFDSTAIQNSNSYASRGSYRYAGEESTNVERGQETVTEECSSDGNNDAEKAGDTRAAKPNGGLIQQRRRITREDSASSMSSDGGGLRIVANPLVSENIVLRRELAIQDREKRPLVRRISMMISTSGEQKGSSNVGPQNERGQVLTENEKQDLNDGNPERKISIPLSEVEELLRLVDGEDNCQM